MSESDLPIASLPISRRQLLGAGSTATALAALGMGGATAPAIAAAPISAYTAAPQAHFLLDGADQGIVSAVSGGTLMMHPSGSINVDSFGVENVVLTCDPASMRKSFFDWVNTCLQGQPGSAQYAEIVFADVKGEALNSLRLFAPRAISLALAELDAAQAKSRVNVDVTIAATSANREFRASTAVSSTLRQPKPLLMGNFALFIQGFEEVTRYTQSVGQLGVTIAQQTMAGRRDPRAGTRQCGPLTFRVRESKELERLYQWFTRWQKGSPDPRQGVLQFFDSTMKDVRASVDLIDLSPLRISGLSVPRDDGVPVTEVTLQPVDLFFSFG